MDKVNFQLPMISYRQHQNTENEKFELPNSNPGNMFRFMALVLFIISGILLVISLNFGSSSGLEIIKMPEIQFPKLCQFRKCTDVDKFDGNTPKLKKHSFNKLP